MIARCELCGRITNTDSLSVWYGKSICKECYNKDSIRIKGPLAE